MIIWRAKPEMRPGPIIAGVPIPPLKGEGGRHRLRWRPGGASFAPDAPTRRGSRRATLPRKRGRDIGAALAAAALFVAAGNGANAQDNFYSGKQITFVVPTTPGGGFDLYSRTFIEFMRRYIPGQPTVVVQNMPGAGGIRAANFMYTVASRDGATFGMPISLPARRTSCGKHHAGHDRPAGSPGLRVRSTPRRGNPG
jgi:hypothetical protein